jgi:tRNA modification GTPase
MFHPQGRRPFPAPFASFPGTLRDPHSQVVLDQVLVTTFPAPASYTGEDVAEIGVHGNPVVISEVLAGLFRAGAVAAEPGEFTRRAFLHGKMDLLDIEATAQVLGAVSPVAARVALNQLDGAPSRALSGFRQELLEHLAHIEAGINFPEDAIDELDERRVARDFVRILGELERFYQAARHGNLLSLGLGIAFVGRPNTGKSSVLNAILGRERAIVTDIPGTTRDTLEESWTLGGYPVKLIDTAGLRRPGDRVEALGIERTQQAIAEAFLTVGVFDGSLALTPEDREVLTRLHSSGKPPIILLNKQDLRRVIEIREFAPFPVVEASARTGAGIPELLSLLEKRISQEGLPALESLVFLGAQQTDALYKSIQSLKRAHEGLGVLYHDLLSVDVTETIRHLGMVTGETVDPDTLDRIFERFCIGK